MFHGAFNYCLLCHCRHLSLQIDGIITTQAEIHSAVCPPLPSQPLRLPLRELFICALHSSPWKCLCPFPHVAGGPGWGQCWGGHGTPGDVSDPPVSQSGLYQAAPTARRGVCAAGLDTRRGAQGGCDTSSRATEPPQPARTPGTHPTCRARPPHGLHVPGRGPTGVAPHALRTPSPPRPRQHVAPEQGLCLHGQRRAAACTAPGSNPRTPPKPLPPLQTVPTVLPEPFQDTGEPQCKCGSPRRYAGTLGVPGAGAVLEEIMKPSLSIKFTARCRGSATGVLQGVGGG